MSLYPSARQTLPSRDEAIANLVVKTEPNYGFGKPGYFANEYRFFTFAKVGTMELAMVYANSDDDESREWARSTAIALINDSFPGVREPTMPTTAPKVRRSRSYRDAYFVTLPNGKRYEILARVGALEFASIFRAEPDYRRIACTSRTGRAVVDALAFHLA